MPHLIRILSTRLQKSSLNYKQELLCLGLLHLSVGPVVTIYWFSYSTSYQNYSRRHMFFEHQIE